MCSVDGSRRPKWGTKQLSDHVEPTNFQLQHVRQQTVDAASHVETFETELPSWQIDRFLFHWHLAHLQRCFTFTYSSFWTTPQVQLDSRTQSRWIWKPCGSGLVLWRGPHQWRQKDTTHFAKCISIPDVEICLKYVEMLLRNCLDTVWYESDIIYIHLHSTVLGQSDTFDMFDSEMLGRWQMAWHPDSSRWPRQTEFWWSTTRQEEFVTWLDRCSFIL